MRRPDLAGTLLAVFTSRDRASEIYGDLIEEKSLHQRGWFGWQVLATMLFLYKEQVLRTAMVTLLGSIFLTEFLFLGTWNLSNVIGFSQDSMYFATFSLAYLLTGISLTLLFRQAGTTIAFTTALFTVVIWIGLILASPVSGPSVTYGILDSVWLTSLLLGLVIFVLFALPMIFGCIFIEYRRQIASYRKTVLKDYGV